VARPKGPVGSITLICGSMFSGKTEELIRLVRRAMHARKRVQVFKSSVDVRSETTVIRTHDGVCFNALAVPDARTLESLLEPDVQVIGIEEIQFFDEAVVPLCQRLVDRGVEVIAAGLDQDFRGLPFGFMPVLMALADDVLKLHAICKVCGREASRTQRLVNGRPAAWNEPTILIGADESYEARCRRCHRVRGVPRAFQASASRPVNDDAEHEEPGRTRGRKARRSASEKNGMTNDALAGIAFSEDDDGTQLEMFEEETG
jgi:thymidine kinase